MREKTARCIGFLCALAETPIYIKSYCAASVLILVWRGAVVRFAVGIARTEKANPLDCGSENVRSR